MKRILSILLVFIMVLSLCVPSYAISDNENEVSGIKLQILKLKAEVSGKSANETASDILISLGMPVEQINRIPNEKMTDIASCEKI